MNRLDYQYFFLWTSRFTTILSQCRANQCIMCSQKWCSWKLANIHGKTTVRVSFLLKLRASGFSKNPGARVCLWILQNFKNTFFHFLWQIPVFFLGYVKRKLYSEQPTILFARRHLNEILLTLLTVILMISISSRIFSKKHTVSEVLTV